MPLPTEIDTPEKAKSWLSLFTFRNFIAVLASCTIAITLYGVWEQRGTPALMTAINAFTQNNSMVQWAVVAIAAGMFVNWIIRFVNDGNDKVYRVVKDQMDAQVKDLKSQIDELKVELKEVRMSEAECRTERIRDQLEFSTQIEELRKQNAAAIASLRDTATFNRRAGAKRANQN